MRPGGHPLTERIRILAAGLLAAVLVAACGPAFTYKHLDLLIPWYVDGYVDLTSDQRAILRGQLEPLLQWHREEELASYIAILDGVETDLSGEVTPAQVQGWIDAVTAAAERTEVSMLDLALDFGARLSDAQMAEFRDSLWEQQREYEEEFLGRSDEEYREDGYDAMVAVFERFAGGLEAAQEARLRAAAERLQRFDAPWLEDRASWLRELEPLLQRPAGWQQRVRAAYRTRSDRRSALYTERLEQNLAAVRPAVADVLNTLTPKQRRRLAEEVEDLRQKLRKLGGA